MAERIPETMVSLGLPITRTEQRDNGMYYFYSDPKNKRERSLWTRTEGGAAFFYCGISSSAAKMLEGLLAAGLFEDDENDT
jgi:hypothetical protein